MMSSKRKVYEIGHLMFVDEHLKFKPVRISWIIYSVLKLFTGFAIADFIV